MLLRDHVESAKSENPGFFSNWLVFPTRWCQVRFWSMDAHLRSAIVFKGASKTIQNELLDSILQVCKGQIPDEVKNFEYLVIKNDETTDVFCKTEQILFWDTLLMQNPINAFGD